MKESSLTETEKAFELEILRTEHLEQLALNGMFALGEGEEGEAPGQIRLDGPKSSLCAWWYGKYIDLSSMDSPQVLRGVLSGGQKVSLINCRISEGDGDYAANTPENKTFYSCSFFFDYAVFGEHISHDQEEIIGVSFVLDDAGIIFDDPAAVGFKRTADESIQRIIQSEIGDAKIKFGDFPLVSYHAGSVEIFASDTVLGKVSARRNPAFDLPRDSGIVRIEDEVYVNLRFSEEIAFEDVVKRVFRVKEFFELLAGRPQNLVDLSIHKRMSRELLDYHGISERDGQEQAILHRVYGTLFPLYERQADHLKPDPSSVLAKAVRDPEEFSVLLKKWLKMGRRDARSRFFGCFAKQTSYDIDRLVAAANMFDILPDDAVSHDIDLEETVKAARDECRKIFKDLPQSPERESVLNALGRVGRNTLKRKIRHRAEYVIDRVGNRVPELPTVTDEAVRCRNHYVHGTPCGIDYDSETKLVVFLTDTLEFVFAVSDLIEAGWDVDRWLNDGRIAYHVFGSYIIHYESNLQRLKNLLSQG